MSSYLDEESISLNMRIKKICLSILFWNKKIKNIIRRVSNGIRTKRDGCYKGVTDTGKKPVSYTHLDVYKRQEEVIIRT